MPPKPIDQPTPAQLLFAFGVDLKDLIADFLRGVVFEFD